jgi:hypothetical protein
MQHKLTTGLPSHIIYTGDVNPLDHGGVWLDVREWSGRHRSAEAVEIYSLDDSEHPYGIVACHLLTGTVHANDAQLESACRYIGRDKEDIDAEEQAYAVACYSGIYDGYNPVLIAWRDIEELSEEQERKIARWVEKKGADYFGKKEDAVECAMRMILGALPA